jgi:hypothetical protein
LTLFVSSIDVKEAPGLAARLWAPAVQAAYVDRRLAQPDRRVFSVGDSSIPVESAHLSIHDGR